jgi:hypothetical protein
MINLARVVIASWQPNQRVYVQRAFSDCCNSMKAHWALMQEAEEKEVKFYFEVLKKEKESAEAERAEAANRRLLAQQQQRQQPAAFIPHAAPRPAN